MELKLTKVTVNSRCVGFVSKREHRDKGQTLLQRDCQSSSNQSTSQFIWSQTAARALRTKTSGCVREDCRELGCFSTNLYLDFTKFPDETGSDR